MNAQSFLQSFPQKVPLPPNSFDQVQNAPSYDAYKCCLEKEIEAGNNPNLLMYARCLGYLLLEAPTTDAQDFLAHEIIECATHRTDMDMLAEFYISHLFRLCMLFCAIWCFPFSFSCYIVRRDKGRMPTPSEHPSRPSFEMHSSFFSVVADPAPRNHTTAKQSVSLFSITKYFWTSLRLIVPEGSVTWRISLHDYSLGRYGLLL